MDGACSISACQNKAAWLCQCKTLFCSMHEQEHRSSNSNHYTFSIFAEPEMSIKNQIVLRVVQAINSLRAYHSESVKFFAELQKTLEQYLASLNAHIDSASQHLINLLKVTHNSKGCSKWKIDESLKNIEKLDKIENLNQNFDFESWVKAIMVDGEIEELKSILMKFNEEKSKKCEECKRNEFDIKRDCTHLICFECLEKTNKCKVCIENGKPIYNESDFINKILLCSLCNSLSQRAKLRCGHFSCSNCKVCSTCKLHICRQCNSPTNFLHQNVCGHFSCFQCINFSCDECKLLEEALNDSGYSQCNKPNCKNQSCGHIGCLKNSEEGSRITCKNCGKIAENIHAGLCGHEICEKCLCQKCKGCDEKKNEIALAVNTVVPALISEEYPKINKKTPQLERNESNRNCPNCKSLSSLMEKKCRHMGCVKCYKGICNLCTLETNSKIIECIKQCTFCNQEADIDTPQDCEHYLCLLCIADSYPCGICNQFCYACSTEAKIVKVLECKHGICEACYRNNFGCKICKHITCSNCTSSVIQFGENACGHRFCLNCFHEHSCRLCDKCAFCGIVCSIKSSYSKCNHLICTKCFQTGKDCLKCFPPCSNCGNQSLNHILQSCKHKMCANCVRLKRECAKCMKLLPATVLMMESQDSQVNYVSKELSDRSIDIQLPEINNPICIYCKKSYSEIRIGCGHYSCKKCYKKAAKICDYCIASQRYCPSCSQPTKEFYLLNCLHIGCFHCSTNFYCFNCICIESVSNRYDESLVCSKCELQSTKYAFLLCGHTCCNRCFTEDIKNFNYLCCLCIFDPPRIRCLSCNQFFSCIKEENTALFRCCSKRICLRCSKVIADGLHLCAVNRIINTLIR